MIQTFDSIFFQASRLFLFSLGMRWSLILFLTFSLTSIGQHPVFHNYDVEAGLVSPVVYDITFDSNNYLWAATSSGISRFNGTNFENFTTENGLVDGEVVKIAEDRKERIWLITFSGKIACYEKKKIKDGYNLIHEIELPIKDVPLNFFEEDQEGNIWLLTPNLAIKISKKGEVSIMNDEILGTIRYLWINQETNDKYLFNQESGILKLENNVWKTAHIYGNDSLTSKHFFTTQDGVILELGGKNYFFNGESIEHYTKGGNTNWEEQINLIIDENNVLWNCTSNGAFGHTKKGQIYSFLEEYSVTDIVVDREGGYWISTKENGLYYSPNLKVKAYSEHGYSGARLSCLAPNAKGGFISGYHDGTFIKSEDPSSNIELSPLKGTSGSPIYQITSSESGQWIASNSEIIHLSDRNISTTMKSAGNKDISDNGNGLIAVAKFDGVSLFEYGDLSKTNDAPILRDFPNSKILNERSFTVHFVNEHELWISGQSGIYTYKNNQLTDFKHNNQLHSQRIKRIASSDIGIIGFASESGGAFIWNQDSLYHIGKEHGLPSLSVRNLYFYKNQLWLATAEGLVKITISNKSPLRYSIINIDVSNGLPSNDVYDVFIKNDTLYAACAKGIVSSPLDQIISDTISFPLKITEVRLNNKSVNWKELNHFNYSENNVEIKYEAVVFRKFGKHLYRYQLKGHDSEWNYTHERKVKYSSLNPGTYSFALELQNSVGQWIKCDEKIDFEITPPFWKNIWFIIIMVVIILAISLLLFSLRIKSVRNKERLKNQLNRRIIELKHQALRSQMNPHFIFNSLNALQKLFVAGETDKAGDYMADFARLVRMILENSEKSEITIDEDLEILNLYINLEKGRLENSIDYQINIDGSLNTFSTYIPPLLLQPVVENAIWHGLVPNKGGMIIISYEPFETGRIKCTIKDNGIGYKKSLEQKSLFHDLNSEKHTSKGIKILEERLEGSQNLEIKDIHPQGTSVTLLIKTLVK